MIAPGGGKCLTLAVDTYINGRKRSRGGSGLLLSKADPEGGMDRGARGPGQAGRQLLPSPHGRSDKCRPPGPRCPPLTRRVHRPGLPPLSHATAPARIKGLFPARHPQVLRVSHPGVVTPADKYTCINL